MKPTSIAIRISAALAAVVLVLGTPAVRTPGADPVSATVVKIKGSPRLVRAHKESALARNTPLQWEDEIVTGAGDSLVIRFATNDILNIGALTRVRLATPPAGGAQVRIDHEQGFVWAKVEKLSAGKDRFEVKTPTAVAGVRGTAFSSVVESPDKSWFCVCEGRVQVTSGEQTVTAVQGQSVTAPGAGALTPPAPDHRLLEKASDATRPCFQCHQGGYSRDTLY